MPAATLARRAERSASVGSGTAAGRPKRQSRKNLCRRGRVRTFRCRRRGAAQSIMTIPEVVADRRVLHGSAILGEANEVDVLDRERLVCRRKSRRQPTLVGSAHRHVGRGHVVVDEDVVDFVAQVAEARAQPLTGRGRAFGSVMALRKRSSFAPTVVPQPRGTSVRPGAAGEHACRRSSTFSAKGRRIGHQASVHPQPSDGGPSPVPATTPADGVVAAAAYAAAASAALLLLVSSNRAVPPTVASCARPRPQREGRIRLPGASCSSRCSGEPCAWTTRAVASAETGIRRLGGDSWQTSLESVREPR